MDKNEPDISEMMNKLYGISRPCEKGCGGDAKHLHAPSTTAPNPTNDELDTPIKKNNRPRLVLRITVLIIVGLVLAWFASVVLHGAIVNLCEGAMVKVLVK